MHISAFAVVTSCVSTGSILSFEVRLDSREQRRETHIIFASELINRHTCARARFGRRIFREIQRLRKAQIVIYWRTPLRQFKEISMTKPWQNMQNHLRQYDNPDVHQKQSGTRSWTIINESRFFRVFYKNRFYGDVNPRVTNADKPIVYQHEKMLAY
jgi:hypothetical protein